MLWCYFSCRCWYQPNELETGRQMGLAKSMRGISRAFTWNKNGPTRNAHAGSCSKKKLQQQQ
eukprot:2138976-Ditylum_brightwellii.AAC.1